MERKYGLIQQGNWSYLMKVGDLVKYGDWYTGKPKFGIIIEATGCYDHFFLVAWPDYQDWEDLEELEVVNENR